MADKSYKKKKTESTKQFWILIISYKQYKIVF